MSIMTSPIKSKSSGIYYFRQAVPKPLIPMIGKREFKVSLKTTNLREAKRLILPLMASANEQISIAQRKLNGDQEECFDADSMQTLTSRDCCIIADRWYEQAKAEIEKTGRFEEFLEYSDRGDGEVHSFGLSDTLSYSGAETKRATRGEWKTLAEELSVHIDFQLSREGLSVTKYSDEYIELAKLFYDRVLYLESICLSRYKRNWSFEPFTRLIASESLSVESHHKQAITGKHKSYTSINDIYEQYRNSEILVHKDNKSRLKTLDEVKHKLSRFIEIVGDKDISQISKSDIIQYKDTLLQLPKSKDISIRSKTIDEKISIAKELQLVLLSSTTVNNSIKQLSLVFSYAVEIGLIDNNPTFGIIVKPSNKKIEVSDIGRGYSSQDVSKLFDDALFHVSSNKHTYGLACYWIPLLCRYTGSRLNEIAQLNSSDVSKSDDGIHFINIRRGEGQSVKTDSSLRHIPIPEHLIELGFLDFVGSSNGNLFPLIPVNKYGARSQAISRWWSKYVKSKGIVISEPVHAFRHSFKTSMRSLGVTDSVSDAITGHSAKTEGGRYGTVPLNTKKEVIDKLPRLKIVKIY